MNLRLTLKLLALALVISGGVLITTEKLNYLKTDTLTALLCTRELLSSETDATKLIADYRNTLQAEARNFDLPPEMLAAIIYGHQRGLTPFRKFTDCAGSALGRNMSLGPAQVRISTAVFSDNLDFSTLSNDQFKTYRRNLLQPEKNIQYEAKILRSLLDRSHRYPDISADEVVSDPFVMALVMSEYRGGPQEQASADSRLSGNAFFDLEHILEDSVFIFGRKEPEVTQIKTSVREYLDYIYCDSGIFNTSTCENTRGTY